ncbi:MAG: SAM-dependent chlorinase/fluorinase [Jiangellaceae bacterium]|nr:SAM-dependent chlorinase/fluorinase [Jiangellaceae bacterium]
MDRYRWIWLLTDYGHRDGFVAACKGVIARIAPSSQVIDISHDVPPGNIRHGAAMLAQTVGYLPASVVVAVVDPGVGTERRGVALAAGDMVLVGPDNGLLPWAADACGGVSAAVELTEPAYRLETPALTFDGRDVFAPAAAHLAAGLPLVALGSAISLPALVRLPAPQTEVMPGRLQTEVLTIDHFGNVQLAAHPDHVFAAELPPGAIQVETAGSALRVMRGRTFADVPSGQLVLFVDSAGQLALAVNGSSAANRLRLAPGDAVTITV